MKFLRWFFAFLILATSWTVWAEDEGIMNRLFAPGPLQLGHAQLEGTDCLKCHSSGKGVPDSKCLDCHKPIKAAVDAHLGYHGTMKGACIKCHSDHKGRDYDSTAFDFKTFDHKLTGYPLVGKHADLKCSECHKETRGNKKLRPNQPVFLGANASSCKTCHAKDDVHFFKGDYAKKDCNACHALEKWKTGIKFDHTKDGHYKIEGTHEKLTCNECHNPEKKGKAGSIYQWPDLKAQKCLSCHENYHKSALSPKFQGGNCTQCHSQTEWKIPHFDHGITKYSLRGKHAEITCSECHTKTLPAPAKKDRMGRAYGKFIEWKGLKAACLSCHKDYHRFGNYKSPMHLKPAQCLSCHDESSWAEVHDFSHNASTRFKIDGEHKKMKCSECHLEVDKKPIPPPRPGVYVWPQLMTKTCEACHKSPHIGKFPKAMLAKRCTECHVTDGWKVIRNNGKNFDHAATRFPLTGKHVGISCTSCHIKNKVEVYKWTTTDKGFCIVCHENVHTRQFDNNLNAQSCGECHSTKNFTERFKFDHNQTRYPLKGAHAKVECSTCHTPTNMLFPVKSGHRMNKYLFPNLEKDSCLACHQDTHRGQLSKNCLQCHNESQWKPFRFDHQTQSKYPLNGKHKELRCDQCHKSDKNNTVQDFSKVYPLVHFKPIGTQCLNCHKDPHNGHFGSSCSSCHAEQTWKVTKDFHRNFTLTGVHFTLQCTECHGQGKMLSGLSQECMVCHKKDDVHSGTLPVCSTCHLQSMWENNKFRHSLTNFPLKGAHRTLQCQSCHANGTYQGLSSECVACHLKDALTATSPAHSPIGNFTNCTQCHHGNSFAW
jgi:hypothetical protein